MFEMLHKKKELRNSKYKCVYCSGKEGIGLKIFELLTNDKTNQQFYGNKGSYEIADWSGDFPDETDDGRILIIQASPIIISSGDGTRIHRDVGVYSYKDDAQSRVGLDYDTYMFVKRWLKMDVLIKNGIL